MNLTDRYVAAVAARVPVSQRAEVEADTRALIADTLEANEGLGELAEKTALEEIGDPERLAASYLDRPLSLIGPRVFLAWKSTLQTVLWIAVPAVALVTLFAKFGDDGSAWDLLSAVLFTGIITATQVAFWLTVGFVIAERANLWEDSPWTVDQLSSEFNSEPSRSNAITDVSILVTAGALAIWAGLARPSFTVDGVEYLVFHPELNSWVLFAIGAVCLIEALPVVIRQVRGRYAFIDILAVIALNVATAAAVLPPLLGHRFLSTTWEHGLISNPAITTANVENIVAACVIAFAVWDILKTIYHYQRDSR